MNLVEREGATRRRHLRHPGRRLLLSSAAVFTALTAVFFWRYALSPATTVSDPGDPLFLVWTMQWVQRALTHAPSALFDAPMFHPFRDVLAYSDPLLPQSVLGLPLRLLGVGPIAMYNVVYLGSIVATGVICTLHFHELTEHRTAALLGAAVATFPTLRLFHLAHMQLQVTAFLPLVFWLVHRVTTRPTRGGAIGLGLAIAAACLGSLYYGLFLALLLPPFAMSVWLCHPTRRPATLLAFAGAGSLAALIVLPFARVYRRALDHLAQARTDHDYCDLSHYLGISPFSDLSAVLPGRVIRDAAPQWIGGGAALLLPAAAVAIILLAVRHVSRRGSFMGFPSWARAALPYVIMGCAGLLLSLGPEIRHDGYVLFRSPLGDLTRLPGVDKIRDFQRIGFVIAAAGGALVAIGLAELSQRGARRLGAAAQAFVVVSTAAPAFSSTLPAYRPSPPSDLAPVYRWLAEQPEPMVIFEAPLPSRGESEPFSYLWAAVHHEKRLVHGFSGYLPFTDTILRDETTNIHRPDLFRSLATLGATHLVVHTKALAELPGGPPALLALRELHGADRIARPAGAEVYRIAPLSSELRPPASHSWQTPTHTAGGELDRSQNCIEIGQVAGSLTLYVQGAARIGALKFVAQSNLGDMDDALLVERSDDLQTWRPARHDPLVSTSLRAYVDRPTPDFWTVAQLPDGPGPFLRLSSRRDLRLRLCRLTLDVTEPEPLITAPHEVLLLSTSAEAHQAPLAADGRLDTQWTSATPQKGGEWLRVDLGRHRNVAAIALELGSSPSDYGRRLDVACIDDGRERPPTAGVDGRAVLFEWPRALQLFRLPAPRTCRILQVAQTGEGPQNFWSIADIVVFERPHRLLPEHAQASGRRR